MTTTWVVGPSFTSCMEFINDQGRYLPAGHVMRPADSVAQLHGMARGPRVFVLNGQGVVPRDFNAMMRYFQASEAEVIWT